MTSSQPCCIIILIIHGHAGAPVVTFCQHDKIVELCSRLSWSTNHSQIVMPTQYTNPQLDWHLIVEVRFQVPGVPICHVEVWSQVPPVPRGRIFGIFGINVRKCEEGVDGMYRCQYYGSSGSGMRTRTGEDGIYDEKNSQNPIAATVHQSSTLKSSILDTTWSHQFCMENQIRQLPCMSHHKWRRARSVMILRHKALTIK